MRGLSLDERDDESRDEIIEEARQNDEDDKHYGNVEN